MLKTKSVYSPISDSDGLRILATRFRGRGMKKSLYHVWMASLGPSEKLLKLVQSGQISFSEFIKHYKKEIFSVDQPDAKNKTIKNHGQKFTLRLIKHLAAKGNVTLMCHCDEASKNCHRHTLQKLILSYKI